jgi:lipopolysaccharide transport system permease protein
MPSSKQVADRAPASEAPVILIRADATWSGVSWPELWAYRELLFFLTWRDVKVRYQQTFLGATWALLQPLLMMAIFTLFFGRLAKMPSDGVPYPVFAYAGLLPWGYVSNAVTNSATSLVGSAHLVTKVYFPRVLIPGAVVLAGLIDYAIGATLLFLLLPIFGPAPTWWLLLLPLLAAWATLLALALGLAMSALTVKYRDVRYALGFAIQVWMFVTPIIYPSHLVPAPWRALLALNPLAGVVQAHRAVILGGPVVWPDLALSFAVTLFLLLLSLFGFRRMERSFADII